MFPLLPSVFSCGLVYSLAAFASGKRNHASIAPIFCIYFLDWWYSVHIAVRDFDGAYGVCIDLVSAVTLSNVVMHNLIRVCKWV